MPRLDHVALQVSDMDASIEFYTEVLGLPLLFKKADSDHNEVFAFLELEGGNLELLALTDSHGNVVPRELPPIEKPYCPHVALGTDDIDAVVAELQAKGIPLVDGPLIIPGQVRWLYLADPDNNIIEYVQWLDAE